MRSVLATVIPALALVALVACRPPTPRVPFGSLDGGLDVFLADHPRAAGQAIRADEVGRTASASYHLVQVCGAERPHRHVAHDLTSVLLRGRGTLTLDGRALSLTAGDVSVVSRGTAHWFASAGGCAITFVAFTPPLDAPDVVPVDSPEAGR